MSYPHEFALSGKDIDKERAAFVGHVHRESEDEYIIP